MTKAKSIIENARTELVKFIAFEVPLLYKKFGWAEPEEGEDYSIPTGDLKKKVFINVEVYTSYLPSLKVETATTEKREIEEVVVSRDGEVWLIAKGQNYTIDEVFMEELAAVAEALELTYIK